MNFNNLFHKSSLKLCLLVLAALIVSSCGKNSGNGSVKTGEGKDSLVQSSKEADKESFDIKYTLVGKREGKMEMIRNNDKLKIVFDFESGGVKSINELYLLNDTVFTVIRQGPSKVGSRTGFKNFKEAYTGNELIIGASELSKYLENTKMIDKEKVLGYDCEIYELSDRTLVSVYNKKYVLKISKPLYIASATSLTIDPEISPKEFQLPDDLEYYDKDKRVIKFGTKEDSIAYYNKK
jgi:hypothetical protein